MKELLNAIKCTIICQLICWGLFILCDENKFIEQADAENLASISSIIILTILLVVYFLYANKYIKKHNLNPIRFNIILFILWIGSSILISNTLTNLVINEKLHICQDHGWNCFLNGFEYTIEAFFMITLAVLILIINIIIAIYKYIKNKKK